MTVPSPVPSSTTVVPISAQAPAHFVVSTGSSLYFASYGSGVFSYNPWFYAYTYNQSVGFPGRLLGITADSAGYLYGMTANGIAIFPPGNALPTSSIPAPFGGPFFTDPEGTQYVAAASGLSPWTIAVYAPGHPSNGSKLREITLGNNPALSVFEIAADSKGTIYILDTSGHLAYLSPSAAGTIAATVLPNQTFYTPNNPSIMAIDSHNQLYLVDSQAHNQIDVGSLQSDGSFAVTSRLIDPQIASQGPLALALDGNDSLYILLDGGEVDFYRAGSAGTKAPDSTSQLSGFHSSDAFLAIPGGAMPTPPPTPGTIAFSPSAISVSAASGSASVAVSEAGYSGNFIVDLTDSTCTGENANPHPSASITPQFGTTFSITAGSPGSCSLTFYDLQGAQASLSVSVGP